jgi:carbon-monoxide dehydrogenase medium subunit
MKPASFDYLAAGSVGEAVAALAAHKDEAKGEAKLIAGGQSLMPMLNFRLLGPALLIDLNRVPGLDRIEEQDGGLRLGAMVRHRALETSPLVSERFPVLAAAMTHVAHLAIRNRGTLGGSLAHADPAAELPMMALLLEADIEIAGAGGARTIAARDFFRGALSTAIAEDEIVTNVVLPALPPATGWGFEEVARRAGDFALAAVATTLSLSGEGVAEARVAVTGAGEKPLRIAAAEALLRDQGAGPDAIAAAARAACEAVEPHGDLHASADYRRHLVGVLTARALEAAARRARGEGA